MIVVSDRISSFDSVLNNLIPNKGAVLNGITNYWFEKTRDIVDNHFIRMIDPNISLVKEAKPICVEMIVRGYLTGSMWRGYQKGKRVFSGIKVNNGLSQNARFEKPIITPTTKEKHDREITPEDIVKEGWTTKETYRKMEEISLNLFELGTKELSEKGIILVDTKYEFGIINGEVILIDEMHTPDSSRFWDKSTYDKDPLKVDSMDKEFIRQWLLHNKVDGIIPNVLPEDVIAEASKRYINIYEKIVEKEFETNEKDIRDRIYNNLLKADLIKDGFVSIIMGSTADLEHCKKIKAALDKYDIFIDMRVVSAHKNGERISEIAEVYNNSIEPGCVIAVAGRSNGLGGALAANLAIPVINCPPFKDKIDMMINTCCAKEFEY
jgi:phosphoribosylaminoimidazole-succinocarboxamide synthase